MPKNLFAVVFTEGREKGFANLKDTHPKAYRLTDTVALVAADALSGQVAKDAGLSRDEPDEEARGVVFKLNGSYTGYSRQTLWEWLEEAEEE